MNDSSVEFDREVIAASHHAPVLVDFRASRCGPRRLLKPALERLAAEASGRWILVKVDPDEQPDRAARFGIRGIPDVRRFHRGVEINRFSGALAEPQLRASLAANLPTPKRETMARARAVCRALFQHPGPRRVVSEEFSRSYGMAVNR